MSAPLLRAFPAYNTDRMNAKGAGAVDKGVSDPRTSFTNETAQNVDDEGRDVIVMLGGKEEMS